MSKRKAIAIPLERLLDDAGFSRNLKLEARSSTRDATLFDVLLDRSVASAQTGRKFENGRKPGTGGPIRLSIARLLKEDAALRNAELWELVGKKPPRGYSFHSNGLGKYIEGPDVARDMGYGRFCNVAAEERGKRAKKV